MSERSMAWSITKKEQAAGAALREKEMLVVKYSMVTDPKYFRSADNFWRLEIIEK